MNWAIDKARETKRLNNIEKQKQNSRNLFMLFFKHPISKNHTEHNIVSKQS